MLKLADLDAMDIRRQDKMILKKMYKKGVEFERISKRRIKISYGNKSYIVRNGRVRDSPNAPGVARIVGMKDVASRLMRRRGYNGLENAAFAREDAERAWNWSQKILPVVLKPSRGNLGRSVYVNIDTHKEFTKRFNQIAKRYDDILVEEFIEGEEYRFLFIKNEIAAINKRMRANVVGDGISTIEELVRRKNAKKANRLNNKKIRLNRRSRRVLMKKGYTFNYVPPKNKRIFIRETANLATGGDALDMTDEISEEIKVHVIGAVKSIKGLFLCGVDVIIKDNVPYIIEINTLPGLLGHEDPWEGKPRNVMDKIVTAMFPNLE